jgi:aldose 1-epimerase
VQYHPVPDDDATLTLNAGGVTLTIHPEAGCRIGQISVVGQPLFVDVAEASHPMTWGSFPMAPWAGRIRNGRFTFDGVEHQLDINHHDGDGPDRAHAIHGLVFDRPCVHDVSDTSCTSTHELDWEFGGLVTQTIELRADRVEITLTIASTGSAFPAELGWHPWFRKPDRLEFSPTAMYQRDEFGIPTGALVEPTEGPWDDCFVNAEPVVLHYDRAVAPSVHVESDCDHWVVYDMPAHSTCVEPQSGPPDAFNLRPHIVDPNTLLRRTMTISW